MKTSFAVVGVVLAALFAQACTAMDGEDARLAKRNVKEAPEVPRSESANRSTTSETSTPSASELQSADAGAAASTAIVSCGGNACSGATPFCCASSDPQTTQCTAATTTSCTESRFLMRCDDASDCGAGEICCAHWDDTAQVSIWHSFCSARSACAVAENADHTVGTVVMCLSNAECGQGSTCSEVMNDWQTVPAAISARYCSHP